MPPAGVPAVALGVGVAVGEGVYVAVGPGAGVLAGTVPVALTYTRPSMPEWTLQWKLYGSGGTRPP